MAQIMRKVRIGRVVGDKEDKTVLVAVQWQQHHRLYKKSMRRITKFHVHDKENQCKLGDLVRIRETRPISRLKRWTVLDILERREVAEIKPIELDDGILSKVSEAEQEAPEQEERA